MRVALVELQTHDQLLALVEQSVHAFGALSRVDLVNGCSHLGFDRRFEVNGVLSHLEWQNGRVRKLNGLVQFGSEILEVVRFGSGVLLGEFVHLHDCLVEHGWWFEGRGSVDGTLQNQVATGSPSQRQIRILLLPVHFAVLNAESKVLADESLEVFALSLVEQDGQKDFEVSGSDTDVSQNIWVVTGVHDDDGLDVGRHFFLSCDLVDQKHAPPLVSVVHHVSQSRHHFNVASRAVASALRNDEPVAQVSALSHMRVDLLENHGKTEEKRASKHLLRKELHRPVGSLEGAAHEFSFGLHHVLKDIVYLAESLLHSVDDRLDLPGIVLSQVFREWDHNLFPVVSQVPQFGPLVGKAQVLEDDEHLSDVSLEPDVVVHDSLCEASEVLLQTQVQEHDVLELLSVALVEVVVDQIGSQVVDPVHLPQHVVVTKVPLQVLEESVRLSTNVVPGLSDKQVHIIGGVHLLEDLQVVLEVVDGLWFVPRLSGDLSLVAGQSLSIYTVISKDTPVF